jgi:CDP-glucose 4,6-dehydratase
VEPDVRGTGSPEGEIDRQYVDSTKLGKACGWSPSVDLAEGLRRTIEWYREHADVRPEVPA